LFGLVVQAENAGATITPRSFRMATKYLRRFTAAAAFAAASAFASTADLGVSWQSTPYTRFDPGAPVTYRFFAKNAGPDAVEARFTMALPPGASFASVSDNKWQCHAAASVVCTRLMSPADTYDESFFDIHLVMSDDPKGGIADTTATIDSDAVDPRPDNNRSPSTLTVYHTFDVTTPDDFGAGSLRAAIEQSNNECDGALPCKIRFDSAMRIAPQTPLPELSGCDVIVDGGVYDPLTFARNRYFDQTRRVEIVGEHVASGAGIVISSHCGTHLGGVTLRGLAIGGFPENGVDLRPTNDHGVRIEGCFIGTDAAGTTAVPNGLRGISADARAGDLSVIDSLLAGNVRSGAALYNIRFADFTGNLIGVRFGGIPMPNGASGVYVAGGFARFTKNAIEYNHDFGIAVDRTAEHVNTAGDYIIANGGLAIDWGLDGPSDLPGFPPVPRLIDAFYDAAKNVTIVRGVLPITLLTAKGFYMVRALMSNGDYEGGITVSSSSGFISTNKLDDVPFEIQINGNRRGQRIGAQSVMYVFLDGLPTDSSEFSASLIVR
jgi:hypothetical protein